MGEIALTTKNLKEEMDSKAQDSLSVSYTACTYIHLQYSSIHACRYMRVLAHLTHAKLQNLVCVCTVAHDFDVCMRDSKHT